MVNAPPLFKLHRDKIRIESSRRADVYSDAHRLPAVDLMIEFRIGPAKPAGMSNHAQLIDHGLPDSFPL